MTLSDRLDHLPERKRRELQFAAQILFEEFEAAQKGKLSDKRKGGRILKLILFGSHARGDWVDDHKTGYHSDYDLLVVVDNECFTDPHDFWERAEERLLRELTVTRRLRTQVSFIVHSIHDLNDQLAYGRPFFVDIARDGIVLYEVEGFPFASPKPLFVAEVRAEAERHFQLQHWFPDAASFEAAAGFLIQRGDLRLAAFLLHQTTERLYHCVLLVVTLYSPKLHRLNRLRPLAEGVDARLIAAWLRDTRFARRCFARLDRAYVDARYSPHYEITGEELAWLVERIGALREIVATICAEKLGGHS
ncbi:HEPN domain-containing protein [Methylobacterium indicum]|uniref:Nucleotidyltransferase n=1 Tax=Methylobacterium indicum TaxID=1775910 RepID=A0A8H8X170_9HYPH|nr:HEPN domain-containing protein [Methylobacterium indicum]BCM87672.1 nucleotidyltransferase [Methylobacterium indicum]